MAATLFCHQFCNRLKLEIEVIKYKKIVRGFHKLPLASAISIYTSQKACFLRLCRLMCGDGSASPKVILLNSVRLRLECGGVASKTERKSRGKAQPFAHRVAQPQEKLVFKSCVDTNGLSRRLM